MAETVSDEMTMHKNQDKIIVTAILKFPFEVYATILFFVCMFTFMLKQIFFDGKDESESWFVLLFGLIIFFWVIYISRQQYKGLVIYNDKVVIRPILSFYSTTITSDKLKGFELFETYVPGGLDYNIRLITSSGKKVFFPMDKYENYDKMIDGFHKSELTFLGKRELQSRYKNINKLIMKWSMILIPVIYGLFLLTKLVKR